MLLDAVHIGSMSVFEYANTRLVRAGRSRGYEIPDAYWTPKSRAVLGENLVMFRTESGLAAALGDVCLHRFAPLHKGKVKGDCIECPYHGLRVDAQGLTSLAGPRT